MMRTNKCFISAPSNFDLLKLENVLNRQNVHYHSFFSFSNRDSFSDVIRSKVKDSDFLIAVLIDNNPNVIFELGVAEGLRKPCMILIEKGSKVPFFLENKLYFQIDFNDLSVFELALSNFIQDLGSVKRQNTRQHVPVTTLLDNTSNLARKVRILRENPNYVEISEVIKDLFLKSDIDTASRIDTPNSGPDLVIRSKGLSPYFGNSIFLEIKYGVLTTARIIETINRMITYIENTEVKFAVLLYLDKNNKRFDRISNSSNTVLLFDLEDFVSKVGVEGMEKVLIEKRNQAAHGNF